jgi:hypothetical protein
VHSLGKRGAGDEGRSRRRWGGAQSGGGDTVSRMPTICLLTMHRKSHTPRSPAPLYMTGCTLCFSLLLQRWSVGNGTATTSSARPTRARSSASRCGSCLIPCSQLQYMRFISNHVHVLAAICISGCCSPQRRTASPSCLATLFIKHLPCVQSHARSTDNSTQCHRESL